MELFTNFQTIMNKYFLGALALLSYIPMMAEGYQINTLSARQLGMGHTGTALKLGAENMIFNPAGLAFSDKTLDLTGTVTGIKAFAECDHDGTTYKTHNGLSTPIAFNAAFRIYKNLQAGISFYTPYGSAINWTNNWPGAVLNQKVNLQIYTIQPTVSWRILPNLSVGAGIMISWGKVDLHKALVSGTSFDAFSGGATSLGNAAAASVGLKGTSQIALGANLGVMYDINDKWTVGVDFRTRMSMNVDAGTATVSYANQTIENLLESSVGLLNQSNFEASMPCPWTLNFGVSYKPTSRWTVAADAQLTGWHTYRQLCISFPDPLQQFDQIITKNYSNAWCFKLGAEYKMTRRLDLRAGLTIDTSPVNDEYYNPETPGMTKIEPTVGFSFRPIERLSIDLAFMYIRGLGKDNVSCPYEDLLLKSAGMPESVYKKHFDADYRVTALAPAIGISYSF